MAKVFYWQGWKAVAGIATSLVAISTAIIAIRTFTVSERTLEANTRQQTSDRFAKAIEQLGNDKSLDMRIGGIYELEQLAHDTPSDYRTVFDVLTAFVRHEVPARSGKCTDPNLHLNLPDGNLNRDASPGADVHAAVDAIGRRDRQNHQPEQLIDLSSTCLVAGGWAYIQLPGVDMNLADLRSAILIGAVLDRVALNEADLTGANLSDASLTGGALLMDANLTEAHLPRANLTDANLSRANLTRADLSGAATKPNPSGAANLTRAILTGANLTEAHLTGANLTRADLTRANLTGADLMDANLTGANLSDIVYDRSTTWPDGFRPPPGMPAS